MLGPPHPDIAEANGFGDAWHLWETGWQAMDWMRQKRPLF